MRKIVLAVFLFFSTVLRAFAVPATGEIIEMPAKPEQGFQWGYVIYLPKTMDTSKPLPILFVMNNNGSYSTQEENIKSVLARFQKRSGDLVEYGIADGVGVPMVMPMVLREELPQNEPQFLYSHELNRAIFVLKDGPYARLDLQALAMLKDARKQLKQRQIRTQKKFLIAGFSAAGAFGNRFALLHPERVLAVATGGDHYPPLPFETYNGVPLIFPTGAYDMETYTGKKFNKRAWLQIPIFISEGGEDYNDPLPYEDTFGDEDRAVVLQVLGEGTGVDRWERVREILAASAPNVQTHTYPNTEHFWAKQDVIDFLNAHKKGGPLKPITPTDTSDRPSNFPIRVTKLYWGDEAKKELTPDLHQYMREREVYMRVEGDNSLPHWVDNITCAVDVLYQGNVVIENKRCASAQFQDTTHHFNLQAIRLTEEEWAALKKTGGRTFSLRTYYPRIWDVPEDLTFTIP